MISVVAGAGIGGGVGAAVGSLAPVVSTVGGAVDNKFVYEYVINNPSASDADIINALDQFKKE